MSHATQPTGSGSGPSAVNPLSSSEEGPSTVRSFFSTIRSKISPDLAAHVAIVAAVVGAVFLSAMNGNFIFLLIAGGGVAGEGYLIYKIYKQSLAQQPASPAVDTSSVSE